jgi:hypothetical protein
MPQDSHLDPPDEPVIEDDDELLSTCCGANADGEIHTYENEEEGVDADQHFGICTWCKEHAEFTTETD